MIPPLTRKSDGLPTSFRVTSDEESGQTIIKGMGELHLDIIVDRRTFFACFRYHRLNNESISNRCSTRNKDNLQEAKTFYFRGNKKNIKLIINFYLNERSIFWFKR